MTVSLRKPILVGGIGLSIFLWTWDTVGHSVMEVGESLFWGLVILGSGVWLFRDQKESKSEITPLLTPITKAMVEEEFSHTEALLTTLEPELPAVEVASLREQLSRLPGLLQREELKVALTGGKNSGKSSLISILQDFERPLEVEFLETAALDTPNESQARVAVETNLAADVVLFVISGDLTDSQWQNLQELRASRQRVLLIFNKQDQYPSTEREMIFQQISYRVRDIIPPEDIVAISAAPNPVKVRQHQEDGSIQEWSEQPEADVKVLTERLEAILTQEQQELVWATTWRQATGLQRQAKDRLNQIRRERALPIIEQNQWIAGAAAFANPVSSLDLLVTAAVSAQMVVDLGSVYQQKFSLSQAQNASVTIGKLMAKLGLVEISTQGVGSLLKSNALTYVAGGTIQGISAAYLTRIAGLSLIEYFQEQEIDTTQEQGFNLDTLGEKIKTIFEQNQRAAILQSFVKQGVAKLGIASTV